MVSDSCESRFVTYRSLLSILLCSFKQFEQVSSDGLTPLTCCLLAEGNELVSRNFNNSNLANAARSHGLEPFIQTHPGQLGSASQGTLADTLEAIVGAVWEDSHSLETVFALLQTMGLDMGL